MSSPKAARGKAKANKARAKTVRATKTRGKTIAAKSSSAKPKSAARKKAGDTSAASAQASELAAAIERGLAERYEAVSLPAMQDLIAALCKDYSARIESGQEILPIRGRTVVSSTDIMTTASGLLKAANLAVFELGMWQSWTGR